MRLVPLDEVDKYTGFRSAFAFDDETAERIREQSNTAGLRGISVFTDILLVDFDASDGNSLRTWLVEQGIGFTRWDSGGRSIHIHVALEPIAGPWVPEACRQFLKKVAPDADVSFLHPSGMFRLPKTFHYKTGRQKVLIEHREGRRLVLQQPQTSPTFQVEGGGSRELFFTLLTARKSEGQRSPWLWRLGTAAAEAGLSYDEALEHLRFWNERFAEPPKDDATVQQQCQSAYRRLARRAT